MIMNTIKRISVYVFTILSFFSKYSDNTVLATPVSDKTSHLVKMTLKCNVYGAHLAKNKNFAKDLCQRVAEKLSAQVVKDSQFQDLAQQGHPGKMGHLVVQVHSLRKVAYSFITGTADEWATGQVPGKTEKHVISIMDANRLDPAIDQIVLDLARMTQ